MRVSSLNDITRVCTLRGGWFFDLLFCISDKRIGSNLIFVSILSMFRFLQLWPWHWFQRRRKLCKFGVPSSRTCEASHQSWGGEEEQVFNNITNIFKNITTIVKNITTIFKNITNISKNIRAKKQKNTHNDINNQPGHRPSWAAATAQSGKTDSTASASWRWTDLAWWVGTMTIDNVDNVHNLDLAWWAGTTWNTRKWLIGLDQWKMSRSMLILVSAWVAPPTQTHLESPQFWTTTIRR